MDLNFSEIAVFSSDDLVPRTVTMLDGETPVEGIVYVKRMASVDIDRYHHEVRDPDREVRVQAVPRLISKAVRKADGKPHFTVDGAGKLTNPNRIVLLNAVIEVNKAIDQEKLGNS